MHTECRQTVKMRTHFLCKGWHDKGDIGATVYAVLKEIITKIRKRTDYLPFQNQERQGYSHWGAVSLLTPPPWGL